MDSSITNTNKGTSQEIPINDDLTDLGVTKFVKQGDLVQIVIDRTKFVSFNIHKTNFQQTIKRFEESALNGTAGLSRDNVKEMELTLVDPDNDYIKFLQPDTESESLDEINRIYATVYTFKNTLYEAVIIDDIPCFLEVERENNNNKKQNRSVQIHIETEVPLIDNDVLLPLPSNLYVSRPYTFKSEKEFHKLVEKVKHETLDSLYQKVKAKWDLYIDNGDMHNIMCAGDTIFTYFQDILGTTHYDFFIGDNGTGKSNNLHVFNLLAYRNVLTISVTAPNLYQLFGDDKHGAVTICEDEADNIDEDTEKMKIYKGGFTSGTHVLRTDISFGRKQQKYRTFGFKACAAEKLPDIRKAKGFLQRNVIHKCSYGNPKYDISEVIEPGGDIILQKLLDDLLELRNILLIYRLLHYYDPIPNVELNIKDREKQIFKPTLRVFQKSSKALKKLKPAINKYLSDYRKRRLNTFHAVLYKVVKELIKEEKTTELKSTLIWTRLKDELQGKNMPNKSMSFECEDFGTVFQGSVSKTLREVFGAEKKRRHEGERFLKFYPKNLNKLSKTYDVTTEIKVKFIHAKKSQKSHFKSKNERETAETVFSGFDKKIQNKNKKISMPVQRSSPASPVSPKENIQKTNQLKRKSEVKETI